MLFSAVALAPRTARVLLIALGVLLLVATVVQLAPAVRRWSLAGALAQAGAVPITLVPGAVMLHEVWAGVLIALSVCLYMRTRWMAAALLGVLALFVRELAAPTASSPEPARHSRQALAGGCGLGGCCGGCYVLYFAWHAQQVQAHARAR